MYALTQHDGSWVMSARTGKRMVWSSRKLAHLAAKHLAKQYGYLKVVDA